VWLLASTHPAISWLLPTWGKSTFTLKYVTFSDGLLGDPVRVDVS
jgi:hypothetical protein